MPVFSWYRVESFDVPGYRFIEISTYLRIGRVLPSVLWHPRFVSANTERFFRRTGIDNRNRVNSIFLCRYRIELDSHSIPITISSMIVGYCCRREGGRRQEEGEGNPATDDTLIFSCN